MRINIEHCQHKNHVESIVSTWFGNEPVIEVRVCQEDEDSAVNYLRSVVGWICKARGLAVPEIGVYLAGTPIAAQGTSPDESLTVEDGHGSKWGPCPTHGCKMQVMRPGDARCPRCEREWWTKWSAKESAQGTSDAGKGETV